MRSKASIAGHPIHPMLIAFPIAFLSGALGFDILGAFSRKRSLEKTAGQLRTLGIISGLVAAVPGIVDYITVVPPRSVGKSDAKKHGIVNSAALALFALASSLRKRKFSSKAVLTAESLGFGFLTYGGWLGGEVAYIDHIGVDRNYAHAGELQEASVTEDPEGTVIAEAGELEVDQMKLIHIRGRRIVLVRNADGYSAIDDRCPHQGGSLADGAAVCGTVQCPWHGSQFDTQTGGLKKGPATRGIQTYPTEVKNGQIILHLRKTTHTSTSPK